MDERIQKYEEKMKKTLASLESELVTIRAGRANPHILDKLAVDYYGAPTPLWKSRKRSYVSSGMCSGSPPETKR